MSVKDYQDLDNKGVLSVAADEILAGIAVDCVIIGFHDKTLKVLLNRFKGYDKWMVPGGFVFKDEDIDDAAHRVLKVRTGLSNIYLRQFHVFGECRRVLEEESLASLLYNDISSDDAANHWAFQRFIGAAYYALVDYSKVKAANTSWEESRWFDIDQVPEKLYGDHNKILEMGLNAIREHLNTIPIDYELLPEKFTMSELRSIYETISGKPLDRRNFQKRMLQSDYIVKLEETKDGHKYKAATLYTFDKDKYKEALKSSAIYLVPKQKV